MPIDYTAEVAGQLLNIKQVEQEFGFPEDTQRYWRAQKTGPRSARIGRRVMYRRADIEAWIDEQFEQGA